MTNIAIGKSPFLIGEPSINGPFFMAMLNNQRVFSPIVGMMIQSDFHSIIFQIGRSTTN